VKRTTPRTTMWEEWQHVKSNSVRRATMCGKQQCKKRQCDAPPNSLMD